MMFATFLIVASFAAYLALLFWANRSARPVEGPLKITRAAAELPGATKKLRVVTWNIGYAGLGRDADLIVDNGTSLRALSAAEITKAARAIADWLVADGSDVVCLQEVPNAGFLTRKVPVRDVIDTALKDRARAFWSDMRSVIAPPLLRVDHGMAVFARRQMQDCAAVALPADDTYLLALLKKHYGTVISRYPIPESGQEWVVFNVHLSAFDEAGHARRKQLNTLIGLAEQAYRDGHFVVIGGDWNMRLTVTDFAHEADPEKLLWVSDFPKEMLPEGWQIALDATTPTVRSLNSAYVPGKNYVTIVDGFVVSPNVAIDTVKTADLGFAWSDHQPVTATFTART